MQQSSIKVPQIHANLRFANLKFLLSFAFVALIQVSIYAQLPTFTINANVTNQSCFGNGSITMTVSGADPAATITYAFYKLPDQTTVISTSNPTSGLQSGTYEVIVTQTLGAESNSQQMTLEVLDEVEQLEYDVTSSVIDCGASHDITVSILQGNAVSFEIFQGPVTYPIQNSPTFTNAPIGVYSIRVFNDCGVGSVKTFTVQSNSTHILIADGTVNGQSSSCNSLTALNTLTSANSEINYPLTLTYTIYPPDGTASYNITQTVNSGPLTTYNATQSMPSYGGQQFNYDLVVVDNCGGVFIKSGNSIRAELSATFSKTLANCGTYYLKLVVNGFVAPYTVTFTSSPAGFNPTAFNANHPTFTQSINSYGSATNAVPFGIYTVNVTDGCGNNATATINLQPITPTPMASFAPFPGCNSYKSKVTIRIPNYKIVTAVIVSAPAGFPFPLPYDVSIYINAQGRVVIPELTNGTYSIVLTDDCGNTYPPFNFVVPDLVTTIIKTPRTECVANGLSSLRLEGDGTTLVSVIMTSAPAAFTASSLPYDVSFNIASDGNFYMANLPVGDYSFKIIDNCNYENNTNVTTAPYATESSNFKIIPQCGSYNLEFNHVSNAGVPKFWLQRFDEVTQTWGHPAFGTPYPPNTLPNVFNSREIQANVTTLNLTQFGQFRIMKSFESFQSGTPEPRYCWEILHEYYFDGEFKITDIFKLTCGGFYTDVEIITNGVAPLIFKITHKNGVPFEVNNGNNNIFPNLEVSFYNFTVEDACGVINAGSFDISELPAKVTAANPENLVQCDDASNDGEAIFDLNSQIPEIIGTQNLSELNIKFYLSEDDAELEQNPIDNPSSFNSSGQAIWVRVYNTVANCHAIGTFNLIINPLPVMDIETRAGICENESTTLSATAGFSSYLWSTGETSREIVVNTTGVYSVTITNDYVEGQCSNTYDITVKTSTAPVIANLTATDWTDNQNTITVELENTSYEDYEFSLDNINFQTSNVFTNLMAGEYTVFVKNIFDCGDDQQDIYILSYPKFFTPNDDGINDFWKVRFSELEPLMETYVYDRYGRFITKFMPDSPGWDGKFNGQRLFATDYWFVVKRQDGRELKGHFALKR